jgi:hypothetical protein
MRSRTIVRVALMAQIGALAMGLFATQALARHFPGTPGPRPTPPDVGTASPMGGQPAGISEQGKYVMSIYGGRIYGPFASGSSAGGVGSSPSPSLFDAPVDLPDLESRRTISGPSPSEVRRSPGPAAGLEVQARSPLLSSTEARREPFTQLLQGASKVLPGAMNDSQRLLAVHVGAETYYVRFKSDEERKQYLDKLKGTVADMGMSIKHSSR